MFNYNREVGYQLITNLLYVLKKLKSEPSYHALVLNEILSKQFISLFIMYKTWRNSKIRNGCLELLEVTQVDLLELKAKEDEVASLADTVRDEINLIESLQDHICIREDVKRKIKKIFN